MRARMAAITYHAPYNQHTIATRNQGDNVSSMLPILGSGDGSCSALETACGHKQALRGHKPQPLTAKTHPPARPMAWCDRTRPLGCAHLQELVISGCWRLRTHLHWEPGGLELNCVHPAPPQRSRSGPVKLTLQALWVGHNMGYLPQRLEQTRYVAKRSSSSQST